MKDTVAIGRLQKTARSLRSRMTPEEIKLWYVLRMKNREGFHFRRQVPLDGYILDFAEFSHRLIIEIDGAQHGLPDAQTRDTLRDQHFIKAGFRVLRFWNNDINFALDGVVLRIEEVLRLPPPSRLRETPPP